MLTNTFFRYFLLLYWIIFFSTALLWRAYRVWKATGINPYRLGNTDTLHDFVGKILNVVGAGCAAIVLLYAFWPDAYPSLVVIPWLMHPALLAAGLIILLLALAWVLVAQVQMGQSWRIGIDSQNKTPLVEQGLFRISRNPIFLGVRFMLLGFLLVLPNAFTLAILFLGDAVIQVQARLEEEYMRELHGEAYAAYCRRVRRWL